MTRVLGSLIGIGILVGGAILVLRLMQPADDPEPARPDPVLTGAYAPELVEVHVLQDHELPAELEPPGVGSDVIYLQVVVLYPRAPDVPAPDDHRLDRVRGDRVDRLSPVHVETWGTDEGAMIAAVFRTVTTFQSARLLRGRTVVADRVLIG